MHFAYAKNSVVLMQKIGLYDHGQRFTYAKNEFVQRLAIDHHRRRSQWVNIMGQF